MRLDEPKRDVQIGRDEILGDINRGTRFRVAEKPVLGKFASVVVDDAIRRRDLRRENLIQLGLASPVGADRSRSES